MDKTAELQDLEKKISEDSSLPLRSNLVFGEGSPDSKIMFIGEAPGVSEDLQKRPFVGRAGQLLREMIREIKWKEDEVYITNIVKRRPPQNRDPLPEEITAYEPYLKKQIEIINPRVIVPLGRFSMNYFLPSAKITRDQGKVFKLPERFIVPMLHPAAALRSTQMMEQFKKTFLKLPKIIERCDKLATESSDVSSGAESSQKSLF